jgi:hypothetical protein
MGTALEGKNYNLSNGLLEISFSDQNIDPCALVFDNFKRTTSKKFLNLFFWVKT